MGYRAMDVVLMGEFQTGGGAASVAPPRPVAAAAAASVAAEPPSRYGEGRRPSWPALAAIAAAHALLLWGLVSMDVIGLTPRRPPPPLMVTLEVEPPPPPEMKPKPEARVQPAAPPLVAPPPIVATVQPPPPIAVERVPPPQAPVVVATPAPPSPAPAPAAIVPPTPLAGKGNQGPKYPIEARRQKWQGTVRLRVLVSVEGRVKDVQVARGSGHDVLDDAAREAVARWRFQPATRAGEPVEEVAYVNITMALKV